MHNKFQQANNAFMSMTRKELQAQALVILRKMRHPDYGRTDHDVLDRQADKLLEAFDFQISLRSKEEGN